MGTGIPNPGETRANMSNPFIWTRHVAHRPQVWHAGTRGNHSSNYFFLFLILSFTFSPQGILSGGNNKSMQGPKLWGRGTFLSIGVLWSPGDEVHDGGSVCLCVLSSHVSVSCVHSSQFQNVWNILWRYEAYKEPGRPQLI